MAQIIKNLIDVDVIESLIEPLTEELKEVRPDTTWNCNRGDIRMIYKPNCLEFLHEELREKIEKETNMDLLPTYWFSTQYVNGGFMIPHRDRPSCQISVTVSFFKDSVWPINIYAYNDEHRLVLLQSVELEPGDGMIYNGTEEIHGRPRSYEGENFIQTFFHYVDANDESYVNHKDIQDSLISVRDKGCDESGPYTGHMMHDDYNGEQQNNE